jgi:hypothetical protein
MSQNYSPSVTTAGLAMCFDGTQGYGAGYNQIRRPTSIPDCVLWLDADDESSITHSSNAISSWADKSSSNYSATQSTTSYKPNYNSTGYLGKGIVEFDGTNDFLTVNTSGWTFGANDGMVMFMVCRQRAFNNTGAGFFFGATSGTSSQNYMGVGDSGGNSMDFRMYGNSASGAETQNYYQDTAGYHLHTGAWNKNSNGEAGAASVFALLDGFRGGTNASNIYTSNFSTTSDAIIGKTAGASYSKIYIAEIIIYNRALTQKERQSVEFYLSYKWDLDQNVYYDTAYLTRWPTDLAGNATNSTGSVGVSQRSPGINAKRGIFLGNESGRYVQYTTTDAISNLGNIGSANNYTIEWAACFLAAKDDGTNYCLFNNETYQSDGIIVRYGGNAYGRPYLRVNHASGSGGTTDSGYLPSDDTVQAGSWHHFQLVCAGGLLYWYKDNVLVETQTGYEAPEIDANDTLQFLSQSSQSFCGEVAFLRLYDKALTAKERIDNYLVTKTRISALPQIAAPSNLKVFCDANQYRTFGASTWYDMTGYGNRAGLTVSGCSQLGQGSNMIWPKQYSFDGTDDNMTWAWKPSASNNAMSYCFWIKFDSWVADAAYNQIYCEESGCWIANYYDKIGFDIHNGSTWVDNNGGVADGLQITVPTADQTDTWLYVALVYEGSGSSTSANFKGYLDGEQNFNVTTSFASGSDGTINSSGGNLEVGKRNTSNFLPGDLANIMVYNKALSAGEVKQNYDYFRNRFGK